MSKTYKPRKFKPQFGTGRQTVTPFTQKEADSLRLMCKQKYTEALNKPPQKKTKNPRWSEAYKWDRNYMLLDLGFNTALRIEDLIQLRVNPQIRKGYVDTKEFKTGRTKPFYLNVRVQKELNDYIERNELLDGEYLFTSRNGYNMPLTRQQSYNWIQTFAKELGIVRKVGCHSMRKTFGSIYYETTKDLAGLHQMIHNGKGDPTVTLIYIGIIDAQIAASRKKFDI